ncbi:MAG: SDR family oxidoreductase [Gallionellaceae bacterium]
MKVLLTGANGNLGRELIRRSIFEFIKLDRSNVNDLENRLEEGVNVVIHAASDLRTSASISPVALFDSNVMLTARLLEGMRKFNTPRLIYISSCAVYGDAEDTNESSRCCPVNTYGISKLLNEKFIEEFCERNNIKFEIVRVFNIYGGNDNFSFFSYVKNAILNGKTITLNNGGSSQRDFIHIEDVASILLRLLEMEVPYTHLNIGTGVAVRISTLMDLIREKYSNIQVLNSQTREVEYSRADNSRLLNLISYDFIRVEDFTKNLFLK